MRPLKCPNCGAPVELPEGQDQVACPFCGAAFLAEKGNPSRSIRIDARGVGEGLRHLARGVVLVGVGLTVLGIGAAVLLLRSPSRAPRSMAPTIRVNPVAPKKALALEDLAKLDKSGEFEIEVAPPPGGFAALDGAAALPWALTIAQRWAADARPTRIDVTRMRPDGTVNASDDAAASVLWRFQSPSRVAAFRERANLEASAQGRFELFLSVRSGKVRVQSTETSSAFLRTLDQVPPFPTVPDLTATLPIASRSAAFPRVPFYSGYLIHLKDEGWCWYLSTLSGEPSIPRVRARDGRLYPYRK